MKALSGRAQTWEPFERTQDTSAYTLFNRLRLDYASVSNAFHGSPDSATLVIHGYKHRLLHGEEHREEKTLRHASRTLLKSPEKKATVSLLPRKHANYSINNNTHINTNQLANTRRTSPPPSCPSTSGSSRFLAPRLGEGSSPSPARPWARRPHPGMPGAWRRRAWQEIWRSRLRSPLRRCYPESSRLLQFNMEDDHGESGEWGDENM